MNGWGEGRGSKGTRLIKRGIAEAEFKSSGNNSTSSSPKTKTMGNKIARTTQVSASEYYLQDLPSTYNLVLKEVLGRGRFLKSVQCKHDEGQVFVKVYFKRGDPLDLKEYERKLHEIKDSLQDIEHSHVCPFQCWCETDKAAYLLRQYFFCNLHDRISTRPFLNTIEKKWLAFQMLYALKQSHEHGVCHGDIKCENVLVTSWSWLYLADYASFKPTYIPDDDPSDFSFFFDTGGRRRCYLAPERFYEPGSEAQIAADATLKPSMDIFSLGCVIAELFLEGQSLFELSQLLAYRRGQYDPGPYLEKISDDGIRSMVRHMIQLDPEARLSCESYLQNYGTIIFPSYFAPLFHSFFSCLVPLDTDSRVAMTVNAYPEILKQLTSISSDAGKKAKNKALNPEANETAISSSTNLSSRFSENFKGSLNRDRHSRKANAGQSYPELTTDISALQRDVEQQNSRQGIKNVSDKVPMSNPGNFVIRKTENNLRRTSLEKENTSDSLQINGEITLTDDVVTGPHTTNCEGMVLIASLLCSCLRSVTLTQSRRGAILLLRNCSYYIDDEARLQHVLPYVVAMLSDPAAIVRCAALETICDVLSLVQGFPPSDAKIFPEYILPMLSMLPDDPEESVRICYAENIYKIAAAASRFLIRSQLLNEMTILDRSNVSNKANKVPFGPSQVPGSQTPGYQQNSNGNAELAQLRQTIAQVIQDLVMGPKQTALIRRALLQHVKELCDFFGEKQCNEFLLPILPAFLNDHDKQLQAVFFQQIIHVCYFVGQMSVEEYLLPYIEQALNEHVEEIIVNALKCLAFLSKEKLLRKRLLLDAVQRAAPLLCHPSQWVRSSAVTFIAASSGSLHPVDSHVHLSPILHPFLRREPTSLDSETDLLSCLKSPISRKDFHNVLEKVKNLQCSEISEKDNSQSKLGQISASPKTVGFVSISSNTDVSNKRIPEKGSSISSTSADLALTKSWPGKKLDLNANMVGSPNRNINLSEAEDSVKMKAMESYLQNLSSTMQTREHSRELENFEKLQISAVVMPPHAGVCSSSNHGPSYEGVPVYIYPLSERKSETGQKGLPSIGLSLNEEWNRDTGGRQGTAPFSMTTFSGTQVAGSVVSSQLNSAIPAADLMHRSLIMTGSFPPKIFTGSMMNGSFAAPKQVSKVIRDGAARTDMTEDAAHLDIVDRVASSPSLSEAVMLSSYSQTSVPDGTWRPQGILVAHLQEHQLAVNDIAVSHDHNFFVTASDDCTVKIWDSRRLEKDISFRSRLTYSLDDGRALHVTMFSGGSQVAVASSRGTINVFSVDYVPRGGGSVERYSGISDIKKKETQEGAVLSLQSYATEGPPMILYNTQHNGIHLWDLRKQNNAWSLKANPEEGYVSSVVLGPCQNWLMSGSSRGVLTLWDLRFLIPVNTWQYTKGCPVEKMCLLMPATNSSPSMTSGSSVYVAAGINEMALWNAKDGSLHRIFRLACSGTGTDVAETPIALARPSSQLYSKSEVTLDPQRNGNSKYRVQDLKEPPSRLPGICSLLPLLGGDVLTGGTDLRIRLWDYFSPDRSYCVCGPSTKNMAEKEIYDTRSNKGVQIIQEVNRQSKLTSKACLEASATDSAGCHRDCILSMASVQLNQRLLISSSRDGAVKVWK